jgi:hypothetical protein
MALQEEQNRPATLTGQIRFAQPRHHVAHGRDRPIQFGDDLRPSLPEVKRSMPR